jgi:hypothetical protein
MDNYKGDAAHNGPDSGSVERTTIKNRDSFFSTTTGNLHYENFTSKTSPHRSRYPQH